MKKSLIILIIFILVILSVLIYKVQPSGIDQTAPVDISRNGEEYLDIVSNDIRNEVLTDIEANEKAIREDALQLEAEFPDSNLLPYTLETNIETFQTNTYIGLRIATLEYTGGAHSNLFFRSINIKNEEEISLSQYLSNKTTTEEEFLNAVNMKLAENGKDQLEDISQISTWNIISETSDVDVMEIMFGPYEVASFAEGETSVQVEVR